MRTVSSTRRRRLVGVVAVVLAIAAMAVVATRRSSASADGAAADRAASTVASTRAASPSAPFVAAAATDRTEVTSHLSSAVTSRWPDGALVRTDRTSSGARASALIYASSVQSQAVYAGAPADQSLLEGWLAPAASPAALDRALHELADARDVLTKGHGPVWWVASPLAARVMTISNDRARVAVWLVRVIASGAERGPGVVPAVSWATSTVDLVWTDPHGWSIESVSDVPGPVPMAQSTAQPATSTEFASRLEGFELVKEHS